MSRSNESSMVVAPHNCSLDVMRLHTEYSDDRCTLNLRMYHHSITCFNVAPSTAVSQTKKPKNPCRTGQFTSRETTLTMSEVRASHLLVKHQGSRRPASWRDPDGAVITKRSKAAALDELEAYREQIESGAVTFADLAAKVSDCSSAKHGGDLGFFGPGKMQKAFEVRMSTARPSLRLVDSSAATNRLVLDFLNEVPFSR